MPQRHDNDLFAVSPEVREALAGGRPVVALESTIVTHGMPHPQNLETARAVEDIVRAEGAVPATIALVDGRIRIGLDAAELERLAAADGVAKASRRDLAALLARKAAAGTTVAATIIAAARARIPIFATGGIGGVHRGASETWDVSADLVELSRTPVAVVCAGAKSILDIAKTLEVLETYGVPVLGFRTGDLLRIASQRGELRARAFVTPAVQPGQIFLPMHYEATNLLTDAVFDPYSHQPAYKACAVTVEAAS